MRHLAVLLLVTACAAAPPAAPVAAPPAPPMSPAIREARIQELAIAQANYDKAPNDADAIIWLGRRTAYLGEYQKAIDIFTEGAKKHPKDARMLRHRGHRFITLRQFDRAIADLTRAAELTKGRKDEIEPDGLPNDRNIPLTTLQSNIWYHLALAHNLRGDFEKALPAWQACMELSKNPDGVVSATHWLYMTLRRLGRPQEAEKTLEPISSDMEVIENLAYHKLLLMYRGEIDPGELAAEDPATVDGATILYGVGNWYLYTGDTERARPVLARVTAGPQWASFGFIAAESDLHRLQ